MISPPWTASFSATISTKRRPARRPRPAPSPSCPSCCAPLVPTRARPYCSGSGDRCGRRREHRGDSPPASRGRRRRAATGPAAFRSGRRIASGRQAGRRENLLSDGGPPCDGRTQSPRPRRARQFEQAAGRRAIAAWSCHCLPTAATAAAQTIEPFGGWQAVQCAVFRRLREHCLTAAIAISRRTRPPAAADKQWHGLGCAVCEMGSYRRLCCFCSGFWKGRQGRNKNRPKIRTRIPLRNRTDCTAQALPPRSPLPAPRSHPGSSAKFLSILRPSAWLFSG